MPDKVTERRAARTRYSLTQPTVKQAGVSAATRAIEAEALAYCHARDHRIRGGTVDADGHRRTGDPQGCRPDLQDALMGRLGQRTELPPLGPSAGPIHRLLDSILADFGEHDLDGLWESVNTARAEEGKDPMAQTAVAIRTRELREHGRTLNHRASDGRTGSDAYWYERPKPPDATG